MKVLYDHQIFSLQKYGGISRYFFELMKHSYGLFEYDVSGVYSENEYVKPLKLFKEFPLKSYFKGKRTIVSVLNKPNSIKKIKQKKYNIIHPTYYDPYVLKYIKDNKLFINEDDFNTRLQKIRNNISSDKFKTIEKNDKLPVFINNIEKEDYILFTGQRGGYKNFGRFIEAVAPLLSRYNLRLICTGQSFTKEEFELLDKNKVRERAVSKFVSENELQNMYEKALLFVFPSLYEGFGIPILEAFVSGCPIVLSNISCFPEIAGEAAMYFNPYSVDDIRQAIEKIILDNSLQKELVKNGFERLKYFSWETTTKKTFKLYSEITPLNNKTKLVITVYDMIHEYFPECFPKNDKTSFNKYIMMINADKIIAISNNTKMDIIKLYPEIDEKKIEVIYLGTSFER